MIAEKSDARRIVHGDVFADVVLVENRRHRRDVFVTETKVNASEPGIAWFHGTNTNTAVGSKHMPRKNLLGQSHRVLGASMPNGRKEDFLLKTGNVEREQSAIFDHLTGDVIFAGRKFTKRDFFSRTDAFNQRKLCRGEQSEILTILLIDPLDVFRDRDLNAGAHFGIRRLFPA